MPVGERIRVTRERSYGTSPTTTWGSPPLKRTSLTNPSTVDLVAGSWRETHCPRNWLAWSPLNWERNPDRSACMSRVWSSVLNWAICAMKSVSF